MLSEVGIYSYQALQQSLTLHIPQTQQIFATATISDILDSYKPFDTGTITAANTLGFPLDKLPDNFSSVRDELHLGNAPELLTELINTGVVYKQTEANQTLNDFYNSSSTNYKQEISTDLILQYAQHERDQVVSQIKNHDLNAKLKVLIRNLLSGTSDSIADYIYPQIFQANSQNRAMLIAAGSILEGNPTDTSYTDIAPKYLSKEEQAWFLINSIFWNDKFQLLNQVEFLDTIYARDLAGEFSDIYADMNYWGELKYSNYVSEFTDFYQKNFAFPLTKDQVINSKAKFTSSDILVINSQNTPDPFQNSRLLWNWVLDGMDTSYLDTVTAKLDITTVKHHYQIPDDSSHVLGDSTTVQHYIYPDFEFLNRLNVALSHETTMLNKLDSTSSTGLALDKLTTNISQLNTLLKTQYTTGLSSEDFQNTSTLLLTMLDSNPSAPSECCVLKIRIAKVADNNIFLVSAQHKYASAEQTELLTEPTADKLAIHADNYLTSIPAGNVRIPVLMYHQIADYSGGGINGAYYVSPDQFEKQMAYLVSQGYHSLSPDEFLNYVNTNSQPAQKSVLITFDDGVRNQYTNAYPILKKYGLTATFFVIGFSNISRDEAKEMVAGGMYIQSHTISHANLATISTDQMWNEILGSKNFIESVTGQPVDAIAYPFCVAGSDAIGIVSASGFKMGFSCDGWIDHRPNRNFVLSRIHVYGNLENFKQRLLGTRPAPPEFPYLPY